MIPAYSLTALGVSIGGKSFRWMNGRSHSIIRECGRIPMVIFNSGDPTRSNGDVMPGIPGTVISLLENRLPGRKLRLTLLFIACILLIRITLLI